MLVALTAAGLGLAVTSPASAQGVLVDPATGRTFTQYYFPYTYGSTSYYYYPNTGYTYAYGYPYTYSPTMPSVTAYGPGYTTYYPYAYSIYYDGNYYYNPTYSYSPNYTRTYRWRWWR
jgi:hypothetical protein